MADEGKVGKLNVEYSGTLTGLEKADREAQRMAKRSGEKAERAFQESLKQSKLDPAVAEEVGRRLSVSLERGTKQATEGLTLVGKRQGQQVGKKFVDGMAQETSGGLSKFQSAAANVLAAAGAAELGVKGLTAGFALLSGDTKRFTDVLETMPAGIGPVVTAMKELVFEINGVREAQQAVAATQAFVATMRQAEQAKIATNSFAASIRNVFFETLAEEGLEKRLFQIELRAQSAKRAIESAVVGGRVSTDDASTLRGSVNAARRNQRRQAIIEDFEARKAANRSEGERAAAQRRQSLDREKRERLRIAQAVDTEQTRLMVERLKFQGRGVDAQIEQEKAAARQRLRTEENAELRKAIFATARERIANLETGRFVGPQVPEGGLGDGGRFVQFDPRLRSVGQQGQSVEKEQVNEQKKTNEILAATKAVLESNAAFTLVGP